MLLNGFFGLLQCTGQFEMTNSLTFKKGETLINCLAYKDLNPLRAGIFSRPFEVGGHISNLNLIQFQTLKASPFGPNAGFGIAPIENIVHHRENPPGIFVSGDQPNDQSVGKGPGMAPGANLHADATVCPCFGPVSKTGLVV
jgi:hypothetical protein